MKDKLVCKSCPERETCSDECSPPTAEEANAAFNELLQFEDIVNNIATSLMGGKVVGLQWVFWNMLSNKYRALADIFGQILEGDRADDDIDWTKIQSIRDLANREDDQSDWFTDAKEV